MPFRIIRDDLTRVQADVLVNTANPQPTIGSGTDSAIYQAAGARQLLAARRAIGPLQPGQAAVTPAFELQAKHIIHTVGPVWVDGRHGEAEVLRSCYGRSLALAAELGAGSIAFPLIATGTYGFPRDEALHIALSEISRFLLHHDMAVTLVVFDRQAFTLSAQLVGDIDQYIDEHGVAALRQAEYGGGERRGGRMSKRLEAPQAFLSTAMLPAEPVPEDSVRDSAPAEASLEELLSSPGETFQQRLFRLIDERGLDDVTVYKRANIDRKLFSRIRCKPDYQPTKRTAVAFAIALRLDLPTMLDLLSRAGLTFSPSSKFDLIVSYFVSHGNYDIYEINAALFQYGQAEVGA